MNKNVLLGAVAVGAVIIVVALFFFSPQERSINNLQTFNKNNQGRTVAIEYHQSSHHKETTSGKKNPQQVKKKVKKRDPTIKYVGMDHHRRYILKLRDKSILEDKEKKISSTGYRLVGGTINGNQFNIKVPEEAIYSSDLELEIIDTKTGQQKKINANFLQELSGLPENSSFMVKINLKNPQNIQTSVFMPTGNRAFEGIKR